MCLILQDFNKDTLPDNHPPTPSQITEMRVSPVLLTLVRAVKD